MITGVMTSDDMDDDGESLMERKSPVISSTHLQQLKKVLNKLPPHIESKILEGYGIDSLNNLKLADFSVVYKKLQKNLEDQNENN